MRISMAPRPVVRILERIARQPTAPMHEHAVLAECARIATGFGSTARADRWGNLILRPPGRGPGVPVWLVAHTDHPALEVVGPRQARLLGGVGAPYFRRGLSFRFYHDGTALTARLARFATKTGRLTLRDGPEARRLRRGDFGVFDLEDFRVARGLVHARQLDDLAGCAVSLAVLERASRGRRINLHVLLTRAEEIGFVGSLGAAADGLIPRNAVVINVEASKALPGVDIGGGPVIRVGDRRRTFDATAEGLLLTARETLSASKPVQRFLMSGGTCEATVWSLYGYRATGVAVPLGNYHNQGPQARLAAEIVSAKDLATAVDLIEAAAQDARPQDAYGARLRRRVDAYLRQYGPRLRASRPRLTR